jgi:phosphopantothenoylcysteine decarboxylase / phosphopantothenate---cysteine ligase
MLQGKTVILGVSGGIAAYKAVEVASRMVKLGAAVHVCMTASAAKLVAPLTFQAISGHPVHSEVMVEQRRGHVDHVDLSRRADLVIAAPATANLIAQMAHGMAADFLTTVILGVTCPVLVAPAMEAEMYSHPLTQANVARLRELGYTVMEPREGRLASGLHGRGRLPEPVEIVEEALRLLLPKRDLEGRTVLVTAGPTREPFDPVRFLSNRSTGKMGFALAQAAAERGARVVLVSGPVSLPDPPGVTVIRVETAQEMLAACLSQFATADITIGAAAPADYRPARVAEQKIKKSGEALDLELVRTPDILEELGRRKRQDQVTVGFAAETENMVENARAKNVRKNLDFTCANDVTQDGAGFGHDTNVITLVGRDGSPEQLPLLSKREAAHRILDKAVTLLGR